MLFGQVIHHKLSRYAVSFDRIIQKNMRHCTDKFIVLQYRAAAHTLHDSTGFAQKVRICYFYDEIFIITTIIIANLCDFRTI